MIAIAALVVMTGLVLALFGTAAGIVYLVTGRHRAGVVGLVSWLLGIVLAIGGMALPLTFWMAAL